MVKISQHNVCTGNTQNLHSAVLTILNATVTLEPALTRSYYVPEIL